MKPLKTKISITIDSTILDEIKKCSEQTDRSVSSYINLVLKAQKYALANIRAGMSCREADSFARETIAANGYGDCFGHSLGHGLGLEIHEAPRVSHKSEEVLQENMVISVEPGIYLKNNFGVRIENIAVVRTEGLQNLTNLTQELLIV